MPKSRWQFAWILTLTLMCLGSGPAYASSAGCPNSFPADGPFYTGSFAPARSFDQPVAAELGQTFRYISYNIKMGEQIADLIGDLRRLTEPAQVDFIMLQEVNGEPDQSSNDAELLAAALNLNYVFAPAFLRDGKEHGTAILSPWPLDHIYKVMLPDSPWTKCRTRAPVAVRAQTNRGPIQLYSVHLSTVFPDTFANEWGRLRQIRPLVEDAARNVPSNVPILVGGDFNSVNPWGWTRVRNLFFRNGFVNAHPSQGWTFKLPRFDLDHAFSRGFTVVASGADRGAQGSDHVPIWGELILE